MSLFANLFGADVPAASALFDASKVPVGNSAAKSALDEAATTRAGGSDGEVPKRKAKRPKAAAPAATLEASAAQGAKAQPEHEPSGRDAADELARAQGSKKGAKQKRDPNTPAATHTSGVDGQPDAPGSATDQVKPKRKAASKAQPAQPQRRVSGVQDGAEDEGAVNRAKRARQLPSKPGRLGDAEAGARAAQEGGGNELDLGSAPEAAAGGDDDGVEEARQQPLFTPEQLGRTVFVGNVPPAVQHKLRKALVDHFSGCGKVESVRLRNVPVQLDSKMPKALQVKAGKVDAERATAIAYVRFASGDSLPAALALNMSLFRGHHLRVDRAAAPAKQGAAGAVRYDPKLSVFVGNLPFNVLEEDLIAVFNSGEHEPQLEGSVRGVRIVRDRNSNLGKGFAYVLFATRTAALAALGMEGRECKGRAMRVTRVAPRRVADGDAGSSKREGGAEARLEARLGAKRGKAGHADWQGQKIRGKGKAGKAKADSSGGGGKVRSGGVQKKRAGKGGPAAASQGGAAPPSSVRKGGKRPAVMARKAKALAASGKLTPAQTKAVLAQAAAKGMRDKRRKGKRSGTTASS